MPIETLFSDGSDGGVKEATIGTHLKLVSVVGSVVTLQDDQQICYRIAISATDYTSPREGSLHASQSPGTPSQALAPGPTPPAPLRTDSKLLNQSWKFLRLDRPSVKLGDDQAAPEFDDSFWETVSLPHTAQIGPLDANSMWQGICWYRLHLNSQPDWKDKKTSLISMVQCLSPTSG